MTSELATLQQLRELPDLLTAIAQSTGSELAVQHKLRRHYCPELVRAAFMLHEARIRARGVLHDAEHLWLTAAGVQQCTHPAVATHKAERFPRNVSVLDLCCGIGSDAAALARRASVTVVDNDETMLQRCRWNLDIWNCSAQPSILDDAQNISLSGRLIHADPDRRVGRVRPVKRLEQYCPDLDWMQAATKTAAGGAIKISSAGNFMQKFPDCEIELVSLHGECREATVWFGELAPAEQFRATVLPSGNTIAGDPLGVTADFAVYPGRYLFDPDPAVVRAGLVDAVCEQLNLQRLDAGEEYLTSDECPDSSFVTEFEVIAVLPNSLKRLRHYFRSKPASRYEIKCRHLSITADAVAKQLPTGGTEPQVVFFLRNCGKTRIIVAKRIGRRLTAE
ncbi:MAG: methyltransferase domain-containing protein [Fuerstiella sp.]|nr:methyltransferase domain-containing protein [Fuerstiella sp.]